MEEELKKIGVGWMVAGFLIPLFGFCLWLFWRKSRSNPDPLILCSLLGFAVNIFLRVLLNA